jgi:hypothetical protein
MSLKDMFKKKYSSTVYCNNCKTHSEVQIPKGITITQFIETGACPNCNCSTLISDYRQIDEFKEQAKPRVQLIGGGGGFLKRARPIRIAPIPQSRPSNMPANAPRPVPRPNPAEPDFRPKFVETDFSLKPVDRRLAERRVERQKERQVEERSVEKPVELIEPAEPYEPFKPKGVYTNDIDFWTGSRKEKERRPSSSNTND